MSSATSRGAVRALRRAASALTLCLATGAAMALSPVMQPPPPPQGKQPPPAQPPRWISVIAAEAQTPIRVRQATVQSRLSGSSAVSRVELTLFNPNARVLSGELRFPLNAGQSVTGFALDIHGVLRRAVPVEKAKGRQVYEDTVRGQVDPALLEVTEGNFYKLQVYPLPAGGTRRVVLEIRETLESPESTGPVWRLPLQFSGAVDQLSADVLIDCVAPRQLAASWGPEALAISPTPEGGSKVTLNRGTAESAGELRITLPARLAAPAVTTERFKGRTYVLAEVPVDARPAPRPAPRTVGLVWDASGSGATRDHDREFALLDAWFRSLGAVDVRLKVVRHEAEAVERFSIRDGEWRALRQRLERVPYDGATALGAMASPEGCDLTLLFSDGVGTWGTGELPAGAAPKASPLYALSASPGASADLLRRVAETRGGAYADLLSVDTAQALTLLGQESPRVLEVSGLGAGEWELGSVQPQGGRLLIAGVMTQAQATMTVVVSTPGGAPRTLTVPLRVAPPPLADEAGAAAPVGLAAYRWASFRLARLDADRERQRQSIRRLGMDFSLPTRETSLIVLDTVADYVRHDIEPPEDLRADWDRLMAQRGARRQDERQWARRDVIRRFEAKMRWWEETPATRAAAARRDEEERVKAAKVAAEAARREVLRQAGESVIPTTPITPLPDQEFRTTPPPASSPTPPPMPAPMPVPTPMPIAPPMPIAAPAPAPVAQDMRAPAAAAPRQRDATSAEAPGTAAIALRPWQPDEPYARRLRAAPDADLYAIYLDEKPSYLNSSAFFLDVADRLLQRKQPELAIRVLSNLAEMDLGNRQLLRILAYRLQQAGRARDAIPVLETVLRLAPDEPQSYRDLGLTLAQVGEPQRAVDQLAEVVNRPWHNRFPDVELIALAELNAIAERSRLQGRPLDLSAIDERLRRQMPLDLRVVLSWDADNTDIDLWVTDPDGERAFYGHVLTRQGGLMSRDFTGGYGPEEFSLRFAKPGTYTVQANFFGHRQQVIAPSTTLMVRLSTGFATAKQQDRDIVLRLTGRGDGVAVGTITIK